MINKILSRKWLTVTVLALALALSAICLALSAPKSVRAEDLEVTLATEFKTGYVVGESLTVPQGEIAYKGGQYPQTSKILIYPNGTEAGVDGEITLTSAGEYSIKYIYDKDGLFLTGVKSFSVVDSLYSVSGEGSSARYSENIKSTGKSGLEVILSPSGTFTYNRALNLNGMKSYNTILGLFVTPEAIGTADVTEFTVRLTDAYDADNYVTIRTIDVASTMPFGSTNAQKVQCNQSANAANQKPTGMRAVQEGTSGAIKYEGGDYIVDVNTKEGYRGFCSFFARDGYGSYPFTLSMDYEERKVYGSDTTTAQTTPSNGMIVDLDDPLFFNDLWQGFTTGEAYLSIYTNGCLTDAFRFAITDICKEDLNERLSEDTVPPVITVDFGGQDAQSLPFAKLNKPFSLYEATVRDNGTVKESNVAVYYNYYGASPVNVSVANGGFTPTRAGVYSIVYYAVDGSGNEATKVVDVEAKAIDGLKLEVVKANAQYKAGERALISVSALNRSGKAKITAVATLNGNDTVKYDLSIEGTEASFTPLYAGEYTINLSVTDYVEELSLEESLTVIANDIWIFDQEINLPDVMVKGVAYQIPAYTAINLSSGEPRRVEGEIKYSFDGGEALPLQNGTLTVEAQGMASIIYSFGAACQKQVDIPVVNVKSGDDYVIKNYFYGEGFTATATEDYASYTTDKDGELTFVKEISATAFTVSFATAKCNFSDMSVSLVDYKDSSARLTVELIPFGEMTKVVVNGVDTAYLSLGLENSNITLSYNQKTGLCQVAGKSVKLTTFEGFPSNLARLSFKLNGVTKQSELRIFSLNHQTISNTTTDLIVPALNYNFVGNFAEFGEEFYFNNIVVSDVLSFTTDLTFTVTSPSGKFCMTNDGVTLKDVTDTTKDYRFTLDEYGDYRISGKYSDGLNVKRFSINVKVEDTKAPTLTITEKVTEASLNKRVDLNKYQVTDDKDTDLQVQIFVIDSAGKITKLSDGGYTPVLVGEHTVIYYVMDGGSNIEMQAYDFIVR